MKVGVYVGSFDPVHKGHIALIRHLLATGRIDKAVIVATGNYWDKDKLAPIRDRLEMLRPYASDQIEIDEENNDKEYSYQVLNALRKRYVSDELYLIIGDDLLAEFHKWKRTDLILKHHVIVVNRLNIDVESVLSHYKDRKRFILVSDFPKYDCSSTDIRRMVGSGETDEKLLELIDSWTLACIRRHGLYKQ